MYVIGVTNKQLKNIVWSLVTVSPQLQLFWNIPDVTGKFFLVVGTVSPQSKHFCNVHGVSGKF